MEILTCTSDALDERLERGLRRLFAVAWSDPGNAFGERDWEHALGGRHFLVLEDGEPASHASVVERVLEAGGVPLRTGYVEAVATVPALQGRGLGSAVMRAAGGHVDAAFELGALSSERRGFYGPLGWVPWRGSTAVRTADGVVPTPDDDGGILVRLTPATPAIDLGGLLTCDWRAGDVW